MGLCGTGRPIMAAGAGRISALFASMRANALLLDLMARND